MNNDYEAHNKNKMRTYIFLGFFSIVVGALINYLVWYDFEMEGFSGARSDEFGILHQWTFGYWLLVYLFQKWIERKKIVSNNIESSRSVMFRSRLSVYLPSLGLLVGLSIPFFLFFQRWVGAMLRGYDQFILIHVLACIGSIGIYNVLCQLKKSLVARILNSLIYYVLVMIVFIYEIFHLGLSSDKSLLDLSAVIILMMSIGIVLADAFAFSKKGQVS
jgi:hypothetical protein